MYAALAKLKAVAPLVNAGAALRERCTAEFRPGFRQLEQRLLPEKSGESDVLWRRLARGRFGKMIF